MASDSVAETLVVHPLLAFVWDRGTHGGRPFQGREGFLCPPVLGRVDDLPLLIQVGHPLLGEGGPDDVADQILHSRFIVGEDAVAAEDVEAGMPPFREYGNHFLGDLSLGEEHLEHFMSEDGLQLVQFKGRGNSDLF